MASASEMTYIVSGGALNSTHSLVYGMTRDYPLVIFSCFGDRNPLFAHLLTSSKNSQHECSA